MESNKIIEQIKKDPEKFAEVLKIILERNESEMLEEVVVQLVLKYGEEISERFEDIEQHRKRKNDDEFERIIKEKKKNNNEDINEIIKDYFQRQRGPRYYPRYDYPKDQIGKYIDGIGTIYLEDKWSK